jgi:putative solute:sodium symporter small subunit
MTPPDAPTPYWRRTRRVTLALLLAWLLATLAAAVLGPVLSVAVLGWPLGFWLGAQGALLMFLGIVAAYVWWMERIERDEDGSESEEPPR